MNKLELVAFEPWHYCLLSKSTGAWETWGEDLVRLVANLHWKRGIAFTALLDGEVVGTAGIVELWQGVAEAWTQLTDKVKNPFFLHRKVKRIMQGVIKTKGYHRVQATADLSDQVAVAWLKRLGFSLEGSLKQFSSDKKDHGIFALVAKD